ncbi:NUDIX hydrolase [Sanguibacter antarcticus]|uniref:8-oxo-dGTP pyrophosphatase MutT (NUDIX family) n=1 Tax=Sanguibacter antarcticus TaxID=372484 RepID=A0A2A9E3H2_9MICO|nr:NUDIX domain-containing protein [Sanguibacter antarcticus]PFG33196.1 8-oxo-dGTP pyrophosphatase MutT (NUDIX family) [Sanguibacter antarcticus]
MHRQSTDPARAAAACLESFVPHDPASAAAQEQASAYLAQHGTAALGRSLPEHLTASALVLDRAGDLTLLCYHRKGRFWVQPGGHLDLTDPDPLAGALRELREETGLDRFTTPLAKPIDIDRHRLGDGFGACTWHIDIAFVVVAEPSDSLEVSHESTDVAWWPVDDLPPESVPGLARRLARPRALVRSGTVL